MILLIVSALSYPHEYLYGAISLDEEEIVFRLEMKGAEKVMLAGDFNGWNPTMDRMSGRDGEFEIRLFLLPGRYRYMFIVDGKQMRDPDNPHVDENGNSFFIFRETQGGWEIVFEGGKSEKGEYEESTYKLSSSIYLDMREGDSSVFVKSGLDASIGERLSADGTIGLEHGFSDISTARGYLVRGYAAYRSQRGSIRAFTRLPILAQADPLSIFGEVGPFHYPLGLFCRGVEVEGEVAFGVDARIFYASRIEGYGSGHQTAEQYPSVEWAGGYSGVDRTDSDMIGLKIGKEMGNLDIDYLGRYDLRPASKVYFDTGGTNHVYMGFEKVRVNGVWLRYSMAERAGVEAEFLKGSTRLTAGEEMLPDHTILENNGIEQEWESGDRIYLGTRFGRDRLDLLLSWVRSTIDGDRSKREGMGRSISNTFDLRLDYKSGAFNGSLRIRAESFSGGGRGSVFWSQRRNFWLDGDLWDTGLLPFMNADGIYEIEVGIGENSRDGVRDPSSTAGSASVLIRGQNEFSGLRLLECKLRKGISLPLKLSIVMDARIHSCGDRWFGRGDLDTYLSLSRKVAGRGWVSLGAGYPPYIFDRYLYRFAPFGRESYLLGKGLLDLPAGADSHLADEAVERAEDLLAGEWMISFEASLDF